MAPAGRSELATSALSDPLAWWGEAGRPAFLPDAFQMVTWPWALAGHAIGGLGLVEPRGVPAAQPWPGLPSARVPLAAWDSLAVDGPDGAWQGFGAPLVTVRDVMLRDRHRTRATLGLASGTSDFDDNTLSIERGDSARVLAVDLGSGTRGAADDVASGGRHLWDARAATTRGALRVEGAIAQRGAAESLESGEVEDAHGQSGAARVTWTTAPAVWTMGLDRALDARTSYGGVLIDSRRDAQENIWSAGMRHAGVDARVALDDAEVRRQGGDLFAARARSWWGALRTTGAFAGGRVTATLGGGRNDAAGGAQLAPSLRWSTTGAGTHAELEASRLLVPVWSDLAPGVAPFLQRSWVGRGALHAVRGRWRLDGDVTGGVTEDRAQLEPAPLDEEWLRAGATADTARYAFVLAHARATLGGRIWSGGVEPYILGDGRDAPGVDPRAGARAWVEWGFHAFERDLGVRLRAEGAGVGRRTAANGTALPGYATLGAAVVLTLEDAIVTIRGFNLENPVRDEPWEDTATGTLAPAPRRQVRVTLSWRLYN